MLDWLRSRAPFLATPADAIVDQLRQRDLTPEQINALRLEALRTGCWQELAVRLPQYFREAFELKGRESSVVVPPQSPERAAEIPLWRLSELSGQSVFLRVARRNGRIDFVAGKINHVGNQGIAFESFDPAVAERLAQPGDSPFFSELHYSEPLPIQKGDTVITLMRLPVDFPNAKSAPPQRRVSLRERAEAVERGEYAPRVDLTNPEVYLARDPETGTPTLDAKGKLVFLDEFCDAVKVEQNVLAMPIIHLVTRRIVEAMRDPEVVAKVAAADIDNISLTLFNAAGRPVNDRVFADLSATPDTALGRALTNLQRVCSFSAAFLPDVITFDHRNDPKNLVEGGAFTAMNVCAGIAKVAADFAQRDPGTSMTELLRSARPLIVRFASAHIWVFSRIEGKSRGVSSYFEVVRRDGVPRLQLKQEFLDELARKRGLRLDTILAGTTGCPAAQSLNGSNAVNDFVEAFVQLMEKREAAQRSVATLVAAE